MAHTMTHKWRFFRAGGVEQVKIESGADVAALGELDLKLWVALSCPSVGLECDPRTLALIDKDGDGRIRASEVVSLGKWLTSLLRAPDDICKGADSVALSAIAETEEGKTVLASAKQVLRYLGKPEAERIGVEDFAQPAQMFQSSRFNGDGIVQADAAEHADDRRAIEEIIQVIGSRPDRSGKPGIGSDEITRYFDAAEALAVHMASAPFGRETEYVLGAFTAVAGKIDDYFLRAGVVAYDPRVAAAKAERERESAEIGDLPLLVPEADKPLSLTQGVNPVWAERLATFAHAVVPRTVGERASLDLAAWRALRARMSAAEAWAASKPQSPVELSRARPFLDVGMRARLLALVAQDESVRKEADAIESVERFVRLHRDFFKLLNNYVAFRDFYQRKDKAIFLAGTLLLDRRGCELCIRVEDAQKHAVLAASSRIHLAYCDCVRKSSGEKICIVAAFTAGDSDNLMVGRNGVFYDRAGRDWDATIIKIVEHPISIRQAFFSPYKKVAKLVEQQVERFASTRDKEASAQAQAHIEGVDKPKPAEKFDVAKFAGVFAAIGLAIGAIGGALGTMLAAFMALRWWQMPLAVLGIVLAISSPSMLMAALKLRQRNIGPLLDASGWAINAKAAINIPFGEALTRLAVLPKGAQRDLVDPYAARGRLRVLLTLLAVVAVGACAYLFRASIIAFFRRS